MVGRLNKCVCVYVWVYVCGKEGFGGCAEMERKGETSTSLHGLVPVFPRSHGGSRARKSVREGRRLKRSRGERGRESQETGDRAKTGEKFGGGWGARSRGDPLQHCKVHDHKTSRLPATRLRTQFLHGRGVCLLTKERVNCTNRVGVNSSSDNKYGQRILQQNTLTM